MDTILDQLLAYVHAATSFVFIMRDKSRRTIMQLAVTMDEVDEFICGLTRTDYYRGPSPDHDGSHDGDIWIFKKDWKFITIYIKLKWYHLSGEPTRIKVLSFHKDFEE